MPNKPRDLSSFADGLRLARLGARLTQLQLAERVGLQQSQIARFERGYRPKEEHVSKIADALGVSIAALLERAPGAASVFEMREPSKRTTA